MSSETGWTGRLEVDCADPAAASQLYQVLAPEAEREVPRARTRLEPPEGRTLVLRLETRDTGALRAAVQTYLGWVQLVGATARSAGSDGTFP